MRFIPAELLAAFTASRSDSPVPLLMLSFSSLVVAIIKVLIKFLARLLVTILFTFFINN